MWATLIPIIGKIVLKGMDMWGEEQRTRFKDKYSDILTRLASAENAQGDKYNDDQLVLAEEELKIFLESYYEEVKKSEITNESKKPSLSVNL